MVGVAPCHTGGRLVSRRHFLSDALRQAAIWPRPQPGEHPQAEDDHQRSAGGVSLQARGVRRGQGLHQAMPVVPPAEPAGRPPGSRRPIPIRRSPSQGRQPAQATIITPRAASPV
eukprot:scaffold337694_cov39-Prasinocladus_malaysianus.AAC.1